MRAQNWCDTAITSTTSTTGNKLVQCVTFSTRRRLPNGTQFLKATIWNAAYKVSLISKEVAFLPATVPPLCLKYIQNWTPNTIHLFYKQEQLTLTFPPVKTFSLICVFMFLSQFQATFDTRSFKHFHVININHEKAHLGLEKILLLIQWGHTNLWSRKKGKKGMTGKRTRTQLPLNAKS